MSDQPKYIVACTGCDMRKETDNFRRAWKFFEKHEEHTGHDCEWSRIEVPELSDAGEQRRFRVVCHQCDLNEVFNSYDVAEDFAGEHETYAGHEVDGIDEIAEDSLSDVQNLKDVVVKLNAEFDDGVPKRLVITAAETIDMTPEEATHGLDRLMQQGEVYQSGPGAVRPT